MRNKKLIIIFSCIGIVALLIILSSVLFSVQNINAYCFNCEDEALAIKIESEVVAKSEIKKGRSIFTLNKKKIINKVESAMINVEVVNVEKKFPNTVYINFKLLKEDYKVRFNNKMYYFANNGRILKIIDLSIDEENTSTKKYIEFIPKGDLTSVNLGDYFATTVPSDAEYFKQIALAISMFENERVIMESIDFIDVKKSNFIYIKTKSGIFIELQSIENTLDKLATAFSLYGTYLQLHPDTNSGTIIVPDGENGVASYNPDNRYENGI